MICSRTWKRLSVIGAVSAALAATILITVMTETAAQDTTSPAHAPRLRVAAAGPADDTPLHGPAYASMTTPDRFAEQSDALPWPTRPITIVVTFPPGGGTDLLARELGGRLSPLLGQQVIVENHPGASGNIGAAAVAQARADGYTLLMVNSSFAINPGVFRNLPFSPTDDFIGVANVAWIPSVWVVPMRSPWQTLPQFLDDVRGAGNALPYASCGNGTPQHLAGEMLRQQAHVALVQVPYRGCGPALTDLIAAQVSLGVVTASSAAPYLGTRLRALAVTADTRTTSLPDVPTVSESDLPGYSMNQWHGVLVPARTPKRVVDRLNHAINQVVAQPDMLSKLMQLGYSPERTTPEAFDALVRRDIARYSTITAQAGLKID